MKQFLLSILLVASSAIIVNAKEIVSTPIDTVKAVKLARKAEKLIASGKQKSIDKGLVLYDKAAMMGLKSAQRWLSQYYWTQNPPLVNAAMYWEQQLANNGDMDSQYLLGWIYLGFDNGEIGIEPNTCKGAEFMHMAAIQGKPEAQTLYGQCLRDGTGVEKNIDEAFFWTKKAADQGVADAQYCVGVDYYFGEGTVIDYKMAYEYTKKAAEQGVADAQFNLGYMYHLAEGVNKDLDEAAYWYSKASEQGISAAKNNLALLLEEKNGKNNESLYLLRISADEGDEIAQYNLGNHYLEGNEVTQNSNMAYHWYRKSADKDYAPGQRQLGLLYLHGTGIDADEQKAFYWLSKAVEQNDTIAINAIGYCYENGKGVTVDAEKAFHCYKQAYEMGYNDAFFNLHRCYYSGIGTEQSHETAFREAIKATQKKIPVALFYAGYACQYGEGTPKNCKEALSYYKQFLETSIDGPVEEIWFYMALCYAELSDKPNMIECYKKSADKGFARAQYNLAICYGNGEGVPVNIEKAKSLLRQCSTQKADEEVRNKAKAILDSIK